MFGMMSGNQVAVTNPAGLDLDAMLKSGVKGAPDVQAMASRDAHSAAVLVWNYHDSERPAPPAPIRLEIAGVPPGRGLMHHYRVDQENSNAYEAWKKMGSPQKPTPEQYAQLEKSGQLQLLEAPRWIRASEGNVRLEFSLPRHAVSLIRIEW